MSYQNHFKKAQKAKKGEGKRSLTEEEVEAQLRKAFGMKTVPATPQKKVIKKNKRKPQSFPLYPIISLTALFLGLSSYMLYPSFFNNIFSHIEISYMGQAVAKSEGKKNPGPSSNSEAKLSSDKGPESSSKTASGEPPVSEDTSYLSKLRERKETLDLREAELNQLEEELQ